MSTPSKEEFIRAIAFAACSDLLEPCPGPACTPCLRRAERIFAVIAQFATAEPAAPGKGKDG